MPKRIFIGSVSMATTDATIRTSFARFGTLVEAVIDRDGNGASLGTAHVEYTTGHAGTDAIAAMNGTVLDGSTITVS